MEAKGQRDDAFVPCSTVFKMVIRLRHRVNRLVVFIVQVSRANRFQRLDDEVPLFRVGARKTA